MRLLLIAAALMLPASLTPAKATLLPYAVGGTHWCNWSITATCQRWKANRHKPSYWRECGPNDMRSSCRARNLR
jgi:hypothetical protein